MASVEANELKGSKVNFEDELRRKFDDVLEKNEQIVKGYKPNKTKMFCSYAFSTWLFVLIFYAFAMIVMFVDNEGMNETSKLIGLIVIHALLVLMLGFNILVTCLAYKNTYYVYTTKRVIIRKGVFGVDFLSLDLKNIGASDVYVSLLDKIIRKNTGSIKFGSNSSPINGQASAYSFWHIEKPYEVYKEIKDYIASVKGEE